MKSKFSLMFLVAVFVLTNAMTATATTYETSKPPVSVQHLGVLALLVIAFVVLVFAFPLKWGEEKKEAIVSPASSEVKVVRVEYFVPVVQKDGVWVTPFKTQADPTKPLFRKEFKKAISAVRSCVRNPYYLSAIVEMIKDGTIKPA